ncbi:MAG: PAS domain S-box protein, partial [Desulfamplus sp.]|nr:PAS domain S-box protein [Desulfamplus sp.]
MPKIVTSIPDHLRDSNSRLGSAPEKWILQQIFDTADVGIVLLNFDAQFLIGNHYAANFFEVNYDDLQGTDYLSYALPEDCDSVMSGINKLRAGEIEVIDVERRYIRKDRSEHWAHWMARLCYGSDGNPIGILGILTDITSRKNAEIVLRRQKDLLDRTGRFAKVGGWELNLATMEGIFSEETTRIRGIDSSSEISGIDYCLSFFSGRNRIAMEEAIHAAITDRLSYALELEMATATGELKWVRIMGSPVVENDQVVRIEGAIQDITDLRAIRSRAEQGETILNSVFQVLPDIYFLVDMDGRIRDYKANSQRDLYVPPETFLNQKITDVLPKEVALKFMNGIESAINDKGLITIEYDLEMPDGQHRYECRINQMGNSTQCIAIVRDITDQHKDRQAIMRSEKHYRTLLESAPFPLLITRLRDGSLRYGNHRAEVQFSFKCEENIGQPFSQFYQQIEDRKPFIRELLEKGELNDKELQLYAGDGCPYWALISATIVEYEGEPAVLIAINEITERKNAEIALELERTKLSTLFRTIPDVVWAKDTEGIYIACNPVFELLCGKKESEIIGKTDYDIVDIERAELFRYYDNKAATTGQIVVREEWFNFANNLYAGMFEIVKNPMYDSSGKMLGILSIARDITETNRNQKLLNERIKEQRCLYDISGITESLESTIESQLQQVAERIQGGWQYPDITEVRIRYEEQDFSTSRFVETPWIQRSEITT